MSGRIRITIGDASIEVDGSKKFVDDKLRDPSVFDDLISKVDELSKKKPVAKKDIALPKAKPKAKPVTRRAAPKKETIKIDSSLSLRAADDAPDLKIFYAENDPTTNLERNVVFVYYLKVIRNLGTVGLVQVYSCYKHVDARVGNINQSLRDTSFKKGWIITKNLDDIDITLAGREFVDHDLPKTTNEK